MSAPAFDISTQFTLRAVGGPMSGQRVLLPFIGERIELSGAGVAPQVYFIVRLRQRRAVALHSSLIGVCTASLEGERGPRAQISDWMERHPSFYKVCRGCESVVHVTFHPVFCPHCHGYGFDAASDAVRAACRALRHSQPIWLRMDVP